MNVLIKVLLTPEMFMSICIFIQIINNLPLNKRSSWTKKYITGEVWESYFIQTFTILLITFFLILINLNHEISSSLLLGEISCHNNGIKALLIFFCILALPAITLGLSLEGIAVFEFHLFFLTLILSSILFVSTSDFLSLFLALNSQAYCFYVLSGFKKDARFSSLESVDYFLFNSIPFWILLFSLSFLYGVLGTLNFESISVRLLSFPYQESYGVNDFMIIVSLLLVILVIFFELGVVPFHFCVPYVYEVEAPLSSILIFSFFPQLIFFDLLIKFNFIFGEVFNSLSLFFIIFGILTVFIGFCYAVYQDELKFFLIFIFISQIGFPIILLGFDLHSPAVQSAIYFFILVYTMMSILAWSFYLIFYKYLGLSEKGSFAIYLGDLSTPFSDIDAVAILFSIIYLLIEIPQFLNFLIDVSIFRGFILDSHVLSVILLIFLCLIFVFFYLRFIKVLGFKKKEKIFFFLLPSTKQLKLFYSTCFVFCLILCFLLTVFLFPGNWLYFAQFLFFTN